MLSNEFDAFSPTFSEMSLHFLKKIALFSIISCATFFLIGDCQAQEQTEHDSGIQKIRSVLTKSEGSNRFLNVDDAFKISLESTDEGIILGRFDVAKGYYLYRNKIAFDKTDGNVDIGRYSLPPGRVITDEYFGEVEIYESSLIFTLPLSLSDDWNSSTPGNIAITINYQGCAKNGICYPPQEKTFFISLSTKVLDAAQSSINSTDRVSTDYVTIMRYLAVAFVAGLLLSFTPCVLPLIPILSSVIAGQGRNINHRRTGMLCIAYVLGTATTYTAIGIVAGTTGDQLQAYFQNSWAIGTVSFILVLMALSLFGIFKLQMPTSIQSRILANKNQFTSGTIVMTFMLGTFSALVVGACVSPVLISVLTIAILKGNPVLGGGLMFSVSIGMGVILVSVGFGASYFLPKVGRWMEHVQIIFGLILLGVSIYILVAIPSVPILALWTILLFITAGYFTWHTIYTKNFLRKITSTAIAVIFAGYALLALIGSINGKRDIFEPAYLIFQEKGIASYINPTEQEEINFKIITTINALDQNLRMAKNENKPVLIDYYAEWCLDCVRMKNTTFQNPQVVSSLEKFLLLQVDITDPTLPVGRLIKKRYDVFGPPAILFIDKTGVEREEQRLFGYKTAEQLLHVVQKLL